MEEKVYLIAGKKFRLKKFEDYTHNEETKIKALMGIKDEDDSIQINTRDNNQVFPLLLEAEDLAVDVSKFDFNDMKNNQVYEVMTDWIASRIFFTQNMGSYFSGLLQKKIPLNGNTKANTEVQENTLQG